MEIAGIEPATLCMLSTRATNCAKSPNSVTGNRTPVSRVTGGDTHHYTNEDLLYTAEALWNLNRASQVESRFSAESWLSQDDNYGGHHAKSPVTPARTWRWTSEPFCESFLRRQLGNMQSLWRNRLARSAVNRKVGGSSPPRDV